MRAMRTLLLAGILASTVLAGCLDDTPSDDTTIDDGNGLTPVPDRHLEPYALDGEWSYPLVNGTFDILDGLSVLVDVDLPPEELGAATFSVEGPQVHLGLFLPDIPGCDWEASELPEECQVPVISDIGPYYGEADTHASEPAERLGRFLIENYVPHGYAVAQVSVFGSGDSNHCFDMFGRSEQLGIDAAVEWLGTQSWSNGAVGLIGRSYDGSTPWAAATFGNEHVKTIVPISGLHGLQELTTRNGSSEARVLTFHNVIYGTYGIDMDEGDVQTLCPDYLTAVPAGAAGYATGDHAIPAEQGYWEERAFLPRALENYDGSVYQIHGLQDWNVDPHMAFPTHQLFEQNGNDVKGLYGQWGHNYPDRGHGHLRLDWAQDLYEWFQYYLKGEGPQPSLHTEVETNTGLWRIEETYPPLDTDWTHLSLADAAEAPTEEVVIAPGGDSHHFTYDPLSDDNDTLLGGLARFHATVTPTGPGGQVFAQLNDAVTGERISFAVMDLRYAAGGDEAQPVVPGMPIVAKMEFQPADHVLPAGHGLELVLSDSGGGYLPSVVSSPVTVDSGEASVLKLPVLHRTAEDYFTPVQPEAEEEETEA